MYIIPDSHVVLNILVKNSHIVLFGGINATVWSWRAKNTSTWIAYKYLPFQFTNPSIQYKRNPQNLTGGWYYRATIVFTCRGEIERSSPSHPTTRRADATNAFLPLWFRHRFVSLLVYDQQPWYWKYLFPFPWNPPVDLWLILFSIIHRTIKRSLSS